MQKLKGLLKNEYVKTVISVAVILGSIAAFWFGLRAYLGTDYPLLAVASGSMVPTLNIGDLIVIQGGLDADDIVAEYATGDVVVFHKPTDPDELIVHRAVEMKLVDGTYYLTTQGDANSGSLPWERDFSVEHVEGKVIWIVPYIGRIPLFVHTPTGMTLVVILIAALVLLEFVVPLAKEKKTPEESTRETDSHTQ